MVGFVVSCLFFRTNFVADSTFIAYRSCVCTTTTYMLQGEGGEGEDVDEDKVLDEEMGVRVEFDRDEEEEEEESDLDEVVDEEDEEEEGEVRVYGCSGLGWNVGVWVLSVCPSVMSSHMVITRTNQINAGGGGGRVWGRGRRRGGPPRGAGRGRDGDGMYVCMYFRAYVMYLRCLSSIFLVPGSNKPAFASLLSQPNKPKTAGGHGGGGAAAVGARGGRLLAAAAAGQVLRGRQPVGQARGGGAAGPYVKGR